MLTDCAALERVPAEVEPIVSDVAELSVEELMALTVDFSTAELVSDIVGGKRWARTEGRIVSHSDYHEEWQNTPHVSIEWKAYK